MKYRIYLVALFVLNLCLSSAFGANGGRVSTFPLQEVRLLDGPFKRACDLNIRVLLQYDTDRLLAPFRKEAGLPMKAELFPNWAGLDGHVAGHYLSALSMAYAATGDEAYKERVDYMLGELKACQEANGDGYLGGIPDGKKTWDEVKAGKGRAVSRLWAPWYNLHKMYAGLRDAWLYTGNGEARRMFLRFCDWGLGIIAPLDDEQMEGMLDTEFGGMNEVYADAYEMTGERKYLDAARRFSHKRLLDSMARRVDNLDNMHANTQVPKAVGYQRVAEVTGDTTFLAAADFFWTTNNANTGRMDIVVYTFPYTSKETFTPEYLVAKRDSVMKANLPGSFPNSYMATEARAGVGYSAITVNGKYCGVMRGLWRMEGDMMGGPFVSVARLDEQNNRVVVAEGFVYAPETDKRNFIRRIEAALYTLRLPDEVEEDFKNPMKL